MVAFDIKMRTYSKMVDAFTHVYFLHLQNHDVDFRVYAMDSSHNRKTEQGYELTMFKKFVSGVRDHIIKCALQTKSPKSFYEIIPNRPVPFAMDIDNPIKAYFLETSNIEILVSTFCEKAKQLWLEETSSDILTLDFYRKRRRLLTEYLTGIVITLVGSPNAELWVFVTSAVSPEKKFPLYLHTNILLDSWSVDGKILACAINLASNLHVLKTLRMEKPSPALLFLCTFLWDWSHMYTNQTQFSPRDVLDVAIYSRNRMFRMFLNTKFGRNKPLCSVDRRDKVRTRSSDLSHNFGDYEEKYEIVVRASSLFKQVPLKLRPCEGVYIGATALRKVQEQEARTGTTFNDLKISRFEEMYTNLEKSPIFRAEKPSREKLFPDVYTQNNCNERIVTFNSGSSQFSLTRGVLAKHMVRFPHVAVFDEYTIKLPASEMKGRNGDTIYCPVCDCSAKSEILGLIVLRCGVPNENPSAVI